MRARILSRIAWREVRGAVRARWFLVGALALALLSIAVSQLGMADAVRWGVSALDRTTAALLNLVLLFVPLLGLPLGAASFAGEAEDGTLGYLIAQPVRRSEVYFGKLLGLCAAMSLSLLLGFGVAAVWVGVRGVVAVGTFAMLALGAWLLGMVTVAMGVALAAVTRSRVRAFAAAVGVWLALVFLCDFGVLAVAAAQVLGPGALFGVAVANPLQAVKTLIALYVSARLEVLGPAGVHAVHVLGRQGLSTVLVGSVGLWLAGAAAVGWLRFHRENLS